MRLEAWISAPWPKRNGTVSGRSCMVLSMGSDYIAWEVGQAFPLSTRRRRLGNTQALSCSLFPRLIFFADLLHLAGVRLSMARIAIQQFTQRDAAALAVIASAVERAGGEILQQLVILRANAAESFERAFRFAPAVIQIRGPQVLVEGDYGGIFFRDDLAE